MGRMGEERATSRRDFLQGKPAIEAIAAVAGEAPRDPAGEFIGPADEAYLVRVGRRAMACQFEVIFNAGQYEDATDRAVEALDLVDALEAQLTVYRDSSEISRLNRAAHEGAVRVERRLFELLQLAAEIHRRTGGAFDITSAPLSRAWGFHQRRPAMPRADELAAARARVGMSKVLLDEEQATVRFTEPGVEINLGSIGKGYALDRAADLLREHGIGDFLLHGGQSSVLASGSQAGGAPGWPIGIRDPVRPSRRLAELRLVERAVGTSGAAVQFFRHQGRRLGHVLDPRTGWPAEGVLSATAIAPTAAEADALATAFYVLGVEEALAYCETKPGVGAVMLGGTKEQGITGLHWAGLREDEIRLLT
jgi:thiamine biosynthesis lipoprotein